VSSLAAKKLYTKFSILSIKLQDRHINKVAAEGVINPAESLSHNLFFFSFLYGIHFAAVQRTEGVERKFFLFSGRFRNLNYYLSVVGARPSR
jgi:hypothetical protein